MLSFRLLIDLPKVLAGMAVSDIGRRILSDLKAMK